MSARRGGPQPGPVVAGRQAASWRYAEVVGLGWALGLALFTATLFLLSLAGTAFATAILPALAVAMAGVALCTRLLWRARRDEPPVSGTCLTAMSAGRCGVAASVGGLGVAAAGVALAAWLALRAPFSAFDAWSVWAFKARMFALGGPRPGYFHDPLTLHTHPDYPLNLPLAEAALFRLPGSLGLPLAALLGPACLAALLLLFYAGLTRLYGRGVAALATGALLAVPALPAQAAGGDADVPLALYAGAAALYLALWWHRRRPADAVLAGLLAGGAIWTKKEGLVVAVLVVLALALGEVIRRDAPGHDVPGRARLWVVARAVLATLAVSLPWLLFTRLTHPIGRDFLPLTPSVLLSHLDRLPHIVGLFALQMLDFANWSLLWVALAGLLLLAARRLSPPRHALLLLLGAQLGLYMLAFVFSDWQPYTAHVQTSLDRLLVQVVPLAMLALMETVHGLSAARVLTTDDEAAAGSSAA